MKRLKGAEIWTDHKGTLAIKTVGGDYAIYLSVDSVTVDQPWGRKALLSEMPSIQAHVASTKLKLLNALKKKDKK